MGGFVGSLVEKLRTASAALSAVPCESVRFTEVLANALCGRALGCATNRKLDRSFSTACRWLIWENPKGNCGPSALRIVGGSE